MGHGTISTSAIVTAPVERRRSCCKSPLWCVALVAICAVVCLIIGVVVGISGFPKGMAIGGAVGGVVGAVLGLLLYAIICYGRQMLVRFRYNPV